MAIIYPYGLSVLADLLVIESIVWSIRRNDEMSGSGDGRTWQAELAPPLWTADVTLSLGYQGALKQVAALLRKLHGGQEAFYLFDPTSPYPQADPTGSILGSSTVLLHTVGLNNRSLRLKGLPNGYVLTLGDKLQITYGEDPTRNAFLEVSETVTASSGGVTPAFEVFPHLPVGLVADLPVTLIKPACKMMLPEGFNPGTSRTIVTEGASFRAIQRKP